MFQFLTNLFSGSSEPTADQNEIITAKKTLSDLEIKCEADILKAKEAVRVAEQRPLGGQQQAGGGRRRRKTASKKSSGKRKTVRKSSMFNIKWPKL